MKTKRWIGLLMILVSATALAQVNPVPLVSQPLVPETVALGSSGFTLTVNGTGFVVGSIVQWNGNPRSTNFVSSSQVTASITAADVAKAKTATVTIVNPSPGGGVSNGSVFVVRVPASSVSLRKTDYGAGSVPLGVVTADFNGDGKPDVAAANYESSSVSIFLGKGNGTFNTDGIVSTCAFPYSAVAADFNNDGHADMALACGSILLGKGDGTFDVLQADFSACSVKFLAVGDFDGDGKLDIVSDDDNNSSGRVCVFLGNGDGTFQSPSFYSTGTRPFSIAVGDLNRDGKIDLAVADYASNTVAILLGQGDGTFQTQVDYATGQNPFAVAVADVNGDGLLDLVVSNQNSLSVSILLGNGDGTFKNHSDFRVSNSPCVIAFGDYNGDGKLDVAVADETKHAISILLGKGDGTFRPSSTFAVDNDSPSSLATADFNGDGKLDFVVGYGVGTSISILLQTVSPTSMLERSPRSRY